MVRVVLILAAIAGLAWGGNPKAQSPALRPVKAGQYYFVSPGDTYAKIAKLRRVDVGKLKKLNNNVALRQGRILLLPEDAAPAPPLPDRGARVPLDQQYYFVAHGDTYEKIAKLKGVDAAALRATNKNAPLRAGRIILLREPVPPAQLAKPAPAPNRHHERTTQAAEPGPVQETL